MKILIDKVIDDAEVCHFNYIRWYIIGIDLNKNKDGFICHYRSGDTLEATVCCCDDEGYPL